MLVRQMSELDVRQSAMQLRQLIPIEDKLTEMCNTMGMLKTHVTWLMNSRREELHANRSAAAANARGRGTSDGDDSQEPSRRLSAGSTDAPRL